MAAATALGGSHSNTPPANRKRDFVGIDTLYVGLGVKWDGEDYERLCERLEAAKAAAQDDPGNTAAATIHIGYLPWVVRPTGAKMGGQSGPLFAYQIERAGIVLQFMRRETPSGEMPNVRIQSGALACLSYGSAQTLVVEMREVINALGGDVVFEKVSRVDLYADLEGLEVAEVVAAFHDDRLIGRARRQGDYGNFVLGRRKPTGLVVGSKIVFRAYDKVEELKRDPVKYGMWKQTQWNDDAPDTCTRFEFEIKRETLADFEIDTVEDLERNIGRILAYLAGSRTVRKSWIRFTARRPDRRNSEKERNADWWNRAIDAWYRWTEEDRPAIRTIELNEVDCSALIRQARGCLQSVAAMKYAGISTVSELAQMARDQLAALEETEKRYGRHTPIPFAVEEKRARMKKRVQSTADRPIRLNPKESAA